MSRELSSTVVFGRPYVIGRFKQNVVNNFSDIFVIHGVHLKN